jgi:hypothetical protein
MNGRHYQKRFETGGNARQADHQTAILFLEPGKGALCLKAGHHLYNWTGPVVLGQPDALGELRPDAALPDL